MKTLVKSTRQLLLLISIILLLSSCYTYKEVINDKYAVGQNKEETITENIKIGDNILLVLNGKTYTNLTVTGIDEQMLSISRHVDGVQFFHLIYIPYIQKLEKLVPDPMYTLGAGYSALLVLIFLLV